MLHFTIWVRPVEKVAGEPAPSTFRATAIPDDGPILEGPPASTSDAAIQSMLDLLNDRYGEENYDCVLEDS